MKENNTLDGAWWDIQPKKQDNKNSREGLDKIWKRVGKQYRGLP